MVNKENFIYKLRYVNVFTKNTVGMGSHRADRVAIVLIHYSKFIYSSSATTY